MLLQSAVHSAPQFTPPTRCAVKNGRGYGLYYKMGIPMKQVHRHLVNCPDAEPGKPLLTPSLWVLCNTQLPQFSLSQHVQEPLNAKALVVRFLGAGGKAQRGFPDYFNSAI